MRTGDVVGVGRRDHGLAARAHELDEPAAAFGVELRGDVVEKHQRSPAAAVEEHVALREEQAEHGRALLALGPEGAQRGAGQRQRDLVAMRPVRGEPAREVCLAPFGELLPQPVGVAGA